MTVSEALQALVDAVDVSTYDEELNTLREAISAESNTDETDYKAELESVKEKLAQKESAYTDLEEKYRKRFKDLIKSGGEEIESKEEEVIKAGVEQDNGRPLTFADLSLTAESE